ncbi:hypothetical protein GXP67_36475 [Rhodocytophaga rosea]|uniref:Tail specific protease domain-containing protein n=1 Tax=Rhodocytophaga rosea TaxID=2704465 RepID=A0A6C0GWN9_9BACT|nr:hypothetical protein [Rhodocytophaga rosea]QHT71772.1 hypothetical protein GXP67_36475 [Rhodocytophaga rosea]
MSSCADVAAILSFNKKAICIGHQTGGGYQRNHSGLIPETTMPPFNFTISVPLQKSVYHVDSSKNIGTGTIPDFEVNQTINDMLEGKDIAKQTAIEL